MPRPARSSTTLRPCQRRVASCRLMLRPAPWHAEANASVMPPARADQDVGRGAHAAADQHRLAGRAQRARQVRMLRPERPRRALAMHVQLAQPAVDDVPLDLAGVVRHVVEQRELRSGQHGLEDTARQMREDLPVRQRTVDRRAHRAEVAFARGRADRRAGELAVGQHDAGGRGRHRHLPQELGADLVAEAARPAVDADDDVAHARARRPRPRPRSYSSTTCCTSR